jgi:hypothetical protein
MIELPKEFDSIFRYIVVVSQALVEQFRAEVDAASEQPRTEPIPDVLPTAEVVEAAEDEEKDDELARLQRLLGMTRTTDAAAEDSDDANGGDDAAKDSSGDEEEG